eukprot:1159338-Pelagomonas_calceolata.AAC.14
MGTRRVIGSAPLFPWQTAQCAQPLSGSRSAWPRSTCCMPAAVVAAAVALTQADHFSISSCTVRTASEWKPSAWPQLTHSAGGLVSIQAVFIQSCFRHQNTIVPLAAVAPWWHEHDLPAADAAGAGREVCEGCQAASQSAEEGEKGGECTMGIRAYGQE